MPGVHPTFLQFGEENDPQGVFHFGARGKNGLTADEINQTLREHMDFQAQKRRW